MNNNIVLIIIDQLRADYIKYMPRCSEILPYHAVCDTYSIPTSTEAMHANISTGKYPKNHGFISKNTKNGRGKGLEEIIKKLDSGELKSLASIAADHGFSSYVVGGKRETARILGEPLESRLNVYFDFDKGLFTVEGNDEGFREVALDYLRKRKYLDIPRKGLDSTLVNIADFITKRKGREASLMMLALPSLDAIGHEFGPNSSEVMTHLLNLDNCLSSLIKQFVDNTEVLLTGDHGCRLVDTYVIEADKDNPRRMYVYKLSDKQAIFSEDHLLDKEEKYAAVEYDGGMLRIWLKKHSDGLSQKDEFFLAKYGDVFGQEDDNSNSEALNTILQHSKHRNIGDYFVLAKPEVIFCKYGWIEEEVQKNKISKTNKLTKSDIPLGEHGTFYKEDREVCMMSNWNLPDRMTNVNIREILVDIMKDYLRYSG